MADTASVADVYAFFAGSGVLTPVGPQKPDAEQKKDYPLAKFRAEWAELTEQDKMDIRTGIGNGSLTY